jgi:DNA-binding NtrC family response regulator
MKILVVDDDKDLNKGICTFLKSNKFETESAFNGKEGFDSLQKNNFDLILSDLQMPEIDGIELLRKLKNENYEIPFIIMTAFASVESAVEAMKLGSDDYLTKPINLKELLLKINKTIKSKNILKENAFLKAKILTYEMPEIIGESESIFELKKLLRRISNNSDIPISIYGKSGTGKELVARNIHFMSDRKNKKFTPINCATLTDELMQSELFGHVKGAFTGALQNKMGIIENSDGGTIFLDEISEMSLSVQAKLLRVLQDSIIQPIGSNESKKVNVRFICASNQEINELVDQKRFREDLYFRLSVVEINIPSLTARKSDIPILLKYFSKKYNQPNLFFDKNALEILMNYNWPGNIRELENLVQMVIVIANNSKITIEDLPKKFLQNKIKDEQNKINFDDDFKSAINNVLINYEKDYLLYHLEKNNFNISQTADSINLSRVSLHKKIKEYSITIAD